MLSIILLVAAFIVAVLATFNLAARPNLIALSVALYFLGLLLPAIER